MIAAGYLVAYDAELIFESLRHIYDHVDAIVVAVDAGRRTFTGGTFELPTGFFERLERIDSRRIIRRYEDHFYQPGLSPMEVDVRARNLLGERKGSGWIVQLDPDEYVYDFATVARYLRAHDAWRLVPRLTPIAIRAEWVTLFKRVAGGYLYLDDGEPFSMATNVPRYHYARRNDAIRKYQSRIKVVHQSWARSDDEIRKKVVSWSHYDEGQRSLDLWLSVTLDNYRPFIDFHPRIPQAYRPFTSCRATASRSSFASMRSGILNSQCRCPVAHCCGLERQQSAASWRERWARVSSRRSPAESPVPRPHRRRVLAQRTMLHFPRCATTPILMTWCGRFAAAGIAEGVDRLVAHLAQTVLPRR